MKKIDKKWWRIINTILIVGGMSMPWMIFYFDIHYAGQKPIPQTGWLFFYSIWRGIIDDFPMTDIGFLITPFLILGLCGGLLLLYLVFSMISIIRNRDHQQKKLLSGLLFGLLVILFFPVLIGGTPFLGYWISNLGILSSIIIEWQE